MIMSSYFNSLDLIARGKYEEKLQLPGLSTLEDPYERWNTDKFGDSMSLWPPVEFGLPPANVPLPTNEEKRAFLIGLKNISPKSVVNVTCFPQNHGDSSVPRTITSLYYPKYKKLSQTVLTKECERVHFWSILEATMEKSGSIG